MTDFTTHKEAMRDKGFTVIPDLFSDSAIAEIVNAVERVDHTPPTSRRTSDLYAIRQFLKKVPDSASVIFNHALNETVNALFGSDYFVVKSIYFDKPGGSNWFVSYHQDLTISVDRKASVEGFGLWSVKQEWFAVQPPLPILESNFTVRIHLDDTDESNGALRVIPGSHHRGIYRAGTIDWAREKEAICRVPKGGIMVMRPLLLHASSRSTSNKNRRVIHIEFSKEVLPYPLQWAERIEGLQTQ